ncbi:hypothetical protein [Magnetospirillum sp. XM-1]|uniref:hypothetical protein n=1 Tax=Magnetospirillum sp. XM-1 TaxID=1663591 RepID=UPI0012E334FA|nr:hypothetical protein [Magnetospirillum sp. XM-1]
MNPKISGMMPPWWSREPPWGRGGIVGQDTAIDQFLVATIWIQSGQIDGVIENSTVRVNRITRVDPRSGDVDFNDLDRNMNRLFRTS